MYFLGTIVYILSAFRPDKPDLENFANHEALFTELSKLYGAVEADGKYLGETGTVFERSIIVHATHDAENKIKALASKYSQECFLKIYPDGHTESVGLNRGPISLGTFIEVNQTDAFNASEYTHVNGKYYIAKSDKYIGRNHTDHAALNKLIIVKGK